MAQAKTQVLQPELVSPVTDGREYIINLGESFKHGLDSSEKLFHTIQCNKDNLPFCLCSHN